MTKKKAYYDAKIHGIKTRPQLRYLLHMYDEYPDQYSWIWDHISPDLVAEMDEEALNTYWTRPYAKSPETPSYNYTGGRKMSEETKKELEQTAAVNKLVKTAQTITPVDEFDAQVVANTFWSLWKTEPVESMWERLANFEDFKMLTSHVQTEVERLISDKLKDR